MARTGAHAHLGATSSSGGHLPNRAYLEYTSDYLRSRTNIIQCLIGRNSRAKKPSDRSQKCGHCGARSSTRGSREPRGENPARKVNCAFRDACTINANNRYGYRSTNGIGSIIHNLLTTPCLQSKDIAYPLGQPTQRINTIGLRSNV